MTHDEAFLQAIIENPEDDTPRLVYADWLEENGKPERAELIRVQCERFRLRYGSPECEARAGKLQARDAELRTKYQKTWVSDLNLPKNRSTHCWFQRGLVATVWCTVRYFIDHADALLAAAPIEAVCFRRVTPRNVTGLVSHPGFARLRGVEFLMDETPAEVVAQFFQTVPVGHLRTVDFSTHIVYDRAPAWHTRNVALATVLARCQGLTGLKRLRWSHGGVGDEGGLALAQSPHLGGLEFLGLQGIALGPEVEAALRQRFGRRLCLGPPDYPNFTLGELGWA
jgi:uncharacterized protein (TIGR02996 family)